MTLEGYDNCTLMIWKIRKYYGEEMGKIRKFDEVFCVNKELFRIFATAFERMDRRV